MKLLKTIKNKDLFPDDPEGNDGSRFIKAARAVVFDSENKIAILKVTKYDYHKLPGGGVEEGEDFKKALKREIKEEIGCEIEVTGEAGEIIEYRDRWNLKQESYCYLAKVIGEKSQPDFTEREKEKGLEVLWVLFDEAIEKLKKDETDNYGGKFVKVRDLCFLEEIKLLLSK